jgi:hypothetical protein
MVSRLRDAVAYYHPRNADDKMNFTWRAVAAAGMRLGSHWDTAGRRSPTARKRLREARAERLVLVHEVDVRGITTRPARLRADLFLRVATRERTLCVDVRFWPVSDLQVNAGGLIVDGRTSTHPGH